MEKNTEAALLSAAIGHRAAQDFDLCLILLNQGAEEFPNFKDSYGHLAFSKEILRTLLQMGEYTKAFNTVTKFALSLDEHAILFARAYQERGDIEAARAWWLRVADLNANNAECVGFFNKHPPIIAARKNKIEVSDPVFARDRAIQMSPPTFLLLGHLGHCLNNKQSLLAKVIDFLHLPVTHDVQDDWAVGILWSPSAYEPELITPAQRAALIGRKKLINDTEFSGNKSNVAHHFYKTFGYRLDVNPLMHHGFMVEKLDGGNGSHSGKEVIGPITNPNDNNVYQIVVENYDGDDVIDLRVPIISSAIPLVYRKMRPRSDRFSNINRLVHLKMPSEVLTSGEIERIIKFAVSIGMDYGELDVLRDKNSNLIYIVDANNTPMGPPNGLSKSESDLAVRILADCMWRSWFNERPATADAHCICGADKRTV